MAAQSQNATIDSLLQETIGFTRALSPDAAIEVGTKAKSLVDNQTPDSLIGEINIILSSAYIIDRSPEALKLLNENKKEWNKLPYNVQGRTLWNFGKYYEYQENLDSALHYFFNALEPFAENYDRKGLAKGYLNIGLAYAKLSDKDLAEPFYKKSMELATDGKTSQSAAGHGIDMESDDRLQVSRDIIKYALDHNDSSSYLAQHDFMARDALKRNLPDTAIHYAKRRLEIINTQDLKYPQSQTYNYLGKAYHQQQKFRQAIFYFEQALENKPIAREKLISMDGMQQSYKSLGEYAQAMDMAVSIIAYKDSLEKSDKDKYLLELSSFFNLDEKKEQLQQLEKEKAAFDRKIQNQQLVTGGAVLLCFLLGGLLVYYRKKKAKEVVPVVNQPSSSLQEGTLALADAKNIYQVKVNEIYYIQSDNNYSIFYTISEKPLIITKPLKHFENILSDKDFFRCHQSYLVALNKISRLDKSEDTLLLINQERIPIATKKKKEFLSRIQEK